MKSFLKLIPVAAILLSLSPLAANATSYRTIPHSTISHSWNADARMLAVNSKGRPGEFAPATGQEAAYAPQYIFSNTPAPNADGAPIQNGN